MAENTNKTNDAPTIFDYNSDGTHPLDEMNETQLSELYFILSKSKPTGTQEDTIEQIKHLKGVEIPMTDFIPINSANRKSSLFTSDGTRNLPIYVLDLLVALLVYNGDTERVKSMTREQLQSALIDYNQTSAAEIQQDFTDLGLEDIMLRMTAEEMSPKKKTPTKGNVLDLREILRDSVTWAKEIHTNGPFLRAIDILKRVKEYTSKRVLGKEAVYINNSFTGLRSVGITGITELFKEDYDAGKEVQTSEQAIWTNSTLLSTSSINLSKNHNNGMGLLGAIKSQKLFLLEEELRLGTEAIIMSLDGRKFHPIGRADFVCMNDLGQLVIIDLKTPVNSPSYVQYVFTRHRAIQLEMYALMFDVICKILGISAGIAYTGILYWNPENNNSFDSKGSATFCKIPRNPELYLNIDTKKKSNLLKSIRL